MPMQTPPPQHIKDLRHDPKNARKHTPRNVGTIVSALQEVGAARSIVIDEQGIVLAGNATLEAAAEAGITKVRVIETNGDELVAVQRTGLTPTQKTRLALYDNRAAELAEWDTAVLHDLSQDGATDGLFTDDELATLLQAERDAEKTEPLTDVTLDAPSMAWCLIGVPVVKWHTIAQVVEQIAATPSVFCEVRVNDAEVEEN
jgi:ParB-like chromosome segregation protein Spo0J